jgi:hypothetical protein
VPGFAEHRRGQSTQWWLGLLRRDHVALNTALASQEPRADRMDDLARVWELACERAADGVVITARFGWAAFAVGAELR